MVTLLLRASSSPLVALPHKASPSYHPQPLRTQSLSCSGALSFYPCCLLLLEATPACTLTVQTAAGLAFGPQG